MAAKAPSEALLARLVDAVEDLLDGEADYADLTVGRICEHAGVGRSTFYLHFEDKAALLVAMTQGVQDIYLDAARAWWEAPADMDRSELEGALKLMVGTYRAHRELLGAVMDAAAYEPAVQQAFGAMVGDIKGGLERHLEAGRAAGHIDASLDPVATAGWLVWTFERGLHQLVRRASDDESDALADTLTAFVWRAVYARRTAEAA